MSELIAIVPWVLFGVMFLFGVIFALVAWRSSSKAGKAAGEVDGLRAHLAQMEARARTAEGRISEAEQRAQLAEQRVAHAEERVVKAREAAKDAEMRAEQAEQRAQGALAEARRADASLQQRRSEAEMKARQAEQRARSLMEWAKQQWESRRESDRQQAQAAQGSFQAQLQTFLQKRREPISFRVSSEVDRMAAPLMPRYASGNRVDVQGDLVTIHFQVDESLGFRA